MIKKIDIDEDCDGTSEVTEELAGSTPDGKELVIKRTVKHYKNDVRVLKNPARLTSSCYSLMGIKWTTFPVTYTINLINTQDLTREFIISEVTSSAETWDAATSKELFNDNYIIDNSGKFGLYDGKNVILFGNNDPSGNTIAVTSTWYTTISRRIVDFDISLEEDYIWGNGLLDNTKMDTRNIIVHELGHGIGLKDLYNSCTLETMYGYSNYGETLKRTLNNGDINGLRKIYGY